jgi:hypothetical protein
MTRRNLTRVRSDAAVLQSGPTWRDTRETSSARPGPTTTPAAVATTGATPATTY